MTPIQNPPEGWLRRLREDCRVWLVKERCEATVMAPFMPSVDGPRPGKLFIQIEDRIHYWYVSADGRGIDGSLLMLPIEGSLPETPVELTSQEAWQIRFELQKLRDEVRYLRLALMGQDRSFMGSSALPRN